MVEFKGITGEGTYRTRNGEIAKVTGNDGDDTYPWDGYVDGYAESWTDGGEIFIQHATPNDIVAGPFNDQPQEMAGLKGYLTVFGTEDDKALLAHGSLYNSPGLPLTLKQEDRPVTTVIDLSKVPASAIVKPEPPKNETRKQWLVFYKDQPTVVLGSKPDRSFTGAVAIVEREIEFTHGDGLEGGS